MIEHTGLRQVVRGTYLGQIAQPGNDGIIKGG